MKGFAFIGLSSFFLLMGFFISNNTFDINLSTGGDFYVNPFNEIAPLLSTALYTLSIGLFMRGVYSIYSEREYYEPPMPVKPQIIATPATTNIAHKKDSLLQYLDDIKNQDIIHLSQEIIQKEKELIVITEIKNHPNLFEDLRKIRTDYLLKILYQYLEVPKNLRTQKTEAQLSVEEMTIEQLKLLKTRVFEIEQEMLNIKTYHIKANERFLKSKFYPEEPNFLEKQ